MGVLFPGDFQCLVSELNHISRDHHNSVIMAGSTTFEWGPALRLDSKKSPFDSPIPNTHRAFVGVKPVSWQRLCVGGILVTVYGLEELARNPRAVTCLWFMHGRGDTQDSMAYTAAALLAAWNSHRRNDTQKGLICVCFDQRNHGSRMVENTHNVSWKQGNATHGPDMFTTYVGTAQDLSLLITQLPMYLSVRIDEHLCGGVSLGGHASWVALLANPQIIGAIIVVGCPDYVRLMTDRAIRSKVPSTLGTDPPGAKFLGSRDFPPALLTAVEQYDPAGILLSERFVPGRVNESSASIPSEAEQKRLRPILQRTLAGKKILCLSGGQDRLVPAACAQPLFTWLQKAIDAREGWARDLNISLVDFVDPGAGHEFSAAMRTEAEKWLYAHFGDEVTSNRGSKF